MGTSKNQEAASGAAVKKRGQFKEIWRRLKKNKMAMIGLGIVALLVLISIFADFLFDYNTIVIKQNTAIRLQTPSAAHWLGTDEFGRDILARLVHGSRVSLSVGVVAVSIALLIGGSLGAIAGFYGGKIDNVIMRIMDIFQSIPMIMMAMCIVAVLGNGIPQLVAAIMFASMPTMARNNRAAILRVRGSDYIESSEAIGVSQIQMILKHMIPNAAGIMIIYFVGFLAVSIMMMSSMSYIGVGLTAPTPEWGLILNDGKAYLTSAPYMMMFPALMIMITCFAFNLMGDGLRDAFDPKMK